MIMEQIAKHVLFAGRVQGVGFRYTADRIARQYDVTGFVRNLPDGRVEMLVQGPAPDVDNCIEDVQRTFAGYIRNAQITEALYEARYRAFGITF